MNHLIDSDYGIHPASPDYNEKEEPYLIECKCCDQITDYNDSVPDYTGEFRYSKTCVSTGDALAYEYEQAYPSEWKTIEDHFNDLNK